MNQHNQPIQPVSAPRARRLVLALSLVGALGAMVTAASSSAGGMGDAGFSGFGGGFGAMFGHHGQRGDAPMDPARMDRHVDKLVERILPDGSAEQKTRLAAIARSALGELQPLRTQLRQNHRAAHMLLTAPVIDRAALEQLRAQQIQQMDAVSKRVLAAMEDAAEVLTPEQRAKFAERLQRRQR